MWVMKLSHPASLVKLSLVLAVAGGLVMLFAPLGTIESGGGTVRHVSLVEWEGWWVAWVALVPVAIAGVVWALQGTRARRVACVTAGVLLVGLCALEAISIGIFFLPAAVVMAVAAFRRDVVRPGSPASAGARC